MILIVQVLGGFMIDITKQRLREQKLRRNERRFREIARAIHELVYSWNRETGAVVWYGDIDKCLGYGPGEAPKSMEAVMARVHPDDQSRVNTAIAQHREEGKPFAVEYRMKCKDGTYRLADTAKR